MKISKTMLRYYLTYVTVGYYSNHDVAPDDLNDYKSCVVELVKLATRAGDLDWLKVAFQYLLTHAEFDTEDLAGDRYVYDNEDMRAILDYIWNTVWPGEKPAWPAELPDVEFVEMEAKAWTVLRNNMIAPV